MSSLPFGSSAGQWRAGLVVRAGAVDGAVVLGDVEVDRPGAQRVGHLLVGGVKFRLRVAFLEQRVLRGVVAEEVEIGVREVRLEADALRHADRLQQVQHVLPGMHAGPADFAFGGETLAVPAATLPASRKVSAIFACCPPGLRTSDPCHPRSRCG